MRNLILALTLFSLNKYTQKENGKMNRKMIKNARKISLIGDYKAASHINSNARVYLTSDWRANLFTLLAVTTAIY